MERKIGEVFEFAGRKLIVEKAKHGSCTGCFFLEKKCLERVHGECCDDYREDNTDVIFKDVTNNNEEL